MEKKGNLLQVIEKCYIENEELILKISSLKERNAWEYSIELDENTKLLSIKETFVTKSGFKMIFAFMNKVQVILGSWKPMQSLIVIDDIFNDKISFNYSNFNDLIRLNKELCHVGKKYRLFGQSAEAKEELDKFFKNLSRIQSDLYSLLSLVADQPKKDISAYQTALNNANQHISNLYKALISSDSSPLKQTQISILPIEDKADRKVSDTRSRAVSNIKTSNLEDFTKSLGMSDSATSDKTPQPTDDDDYYNSDS
jgi:hypothetical protein